MWACAVMYLTTPAEFCIFWHMNLDLIKVPSNMCDHRKIKSACTSTHLIGVFVVGLKNKTIGRCLSTGNLSHIPISQHSCAAQSEKALGAHVICTFSCVNHEFGLIHLVDFPPFYTTETTFVIFCMRYCTPNPFWKVSTLKGKQYRLDTFSDGRQT